MTRSTKRNIADYARGSFTPHGEVELWPDGSLIHIVAHGPFNREALLAVRAAYIELLAQMPAAQPFANVNEFRVSLMTSPEVVAEYRELLIETSQQGRAPLAVAYAVGPEVEGRSLMLPMMERLFTSHGRRFAAFETLAEARQWALAQLAAG